MRFVIPLLLLLPNIALAQERMFNLQLTSKQMEVLWNAIQKAPMPRESTDSVVAEINRQVSQQMEKKPDEKKDEQK